MAYQTRRRDPLLDASVQAALERRGRELAGLVLVALGAALGCLLVSYDAADPSWMTTTDSAPANWLGRPGAAVAGPLMMILGLGAWVLAILPAAWGLRLTLRLGEGRAAVRVILAPVAVVVASLFAATLVPGDGWPARFGMGGMLGDLILSMLLTVSPAALAVTLAAVSLVGGVIAAGLLAWVCGVTRDEASALLRWGWTGLVAIYALIFASGALAVAGARVGARAGAAVGRHGAQAASAQVGALRAAQKERHVALAELDAEAEAAAAPEPSSDSTTIVGAVRAAVAARTSRQDVAEDASPDGISRAISEAIRARARPPLKVSPRVEPALMAEPAPHAAPPSFATIDAAPAMDRPEDPLDRAPVDGAATPVAAPVQPRPVARPRAAATPAPAVEGYDAPALTLLEDPSEVPRMVLSPDALQANARMLESVLEDYGVRGQIVDVRPGPVVTMYELEPAPGLKASRVIGLSDDIARSMSALSARVSTVPGRSVIGIELPNADREKVVLREMLEHRDFGGGRQALPLALGKDIGGDPVVADLAKMPHLLIAGTTGSGKSVAVNTMILSLLYKLGPEQCRLIMIDPKMLELSVYDGIPHLLSPVVTDPKKAVVALKWVVAEMEDRYRKMSKMGVRNIGGYNSRVADALSRGEDFERTVQTGFCDETGDPIFETEVMTPEKMPYIVVIVDEMADLMMVAGKEIEACIQRLAQMARASGIHLIMATQRPSVDVITGTIKANFPTRISFQVTGKIDSRTILGEQGAEQLLGMGDMLYMAGGGKITRVHGPFASDQEVEEVVSHLKALGPPDYASGVVDGPEADGEVDVDVVLGLQASGDDLENALYDTAVAIVAKDRKCSTSYIQRKLAIGYNKAARLVEQMEDQGVVSPANHVGKREVLVPEPA
ncbi:MAG: DNA translocase FtsK [Paracoccaceae bacterium]